MNRNKLIQLLISNLVNVVVHKVLEESVREDILRDHYNKESLVSFETAKKYRERINPIQRKLPDKDTKKIKEEILRRVNNELKTRISKGYKGINLGLVEKVLEKVLEELAI